MAYCILRVVQLIIICYHSQTQRKEKFEPRIKKNFYLSINVCSTKGLLGAPFLRLLMDTGPLIYVVIGAICRAKAVPSFFSYFKTLSSKSGPGNLTLTSRSQWDFTLLCVSLSIF